MKKKLKILCLKINTGTIDMRAMTVIRNLISMTMRDIRGIWKSIRVEEIMRRMMIGIRARKGKFE